MKKWYQVPAVGNYRRNKDFVEIRNEAWQNWIREKPKECNEYQEERHLVKVMAEVEALGICNDEACGLFEFQKRGCELEPIDLDEAA